MKEVEINMKMVASTNTSEKESLNLSDLKQIEHILKPNSCPTKVCTECKRKYIDKLRLNILVICKCKCHQYSPFKTTYSNGQSKADSYDNNYPNYGGL